ncbi:DUF5615 family PIN-like protein [Halalkalicoccus sp. NIPERK01]|uniref:DUF5615 family PIN-like protein n=1 Tax=Halalkalicoccus sp. NIPERK01 TaxID=3053469 RepID=UPI00256F3574|nr:DUF5615 family PIN-like protein [Halalkalicoccus sp. NIPERK01]
MSVLRTKDVFGENTRDDELLRYCATEGYVLITHDRKDFGGETGRSIEHDDIVIYTDANYLRNHPEHAVGTLERILSYYPLNELADELVWLDQWRTD